VLAATGAGGAEKPTGGTLSSEEDRRTLLGIYSSGVLQFAALALASGAATLGEIGLLVQAHGPSWSPRLFFAFILTTALLTLVFADAYRVQRRSIVIVLLHPRPTEKQLREVEKDSKSLRVATRDAEITNGLGVLDKYYTGLVHSENRYDPISWLTWLGPLAIALAALIVLVVSYQFLFPFAAPYV